MLLFWLVPFGLVWFNLVYFDLIWLVGLVAFDSSYIAWRRLPAGVAWGSLPAVPRELSGVSIESRSLVYTTCSQLIGLSPVHVTHMMVREKRELRSPQIHG